MRLALFNTTAFRLSVGYTLLVTLAVGVTLGSAYLLTESLITDEVDLIIDTELKSLRGQVRARRRARRDRRDQPAHRQLGSHRRGLHARRRQLRAHRRQRHRPGRSTACRPSRGRSSRSPPSSRAGAPCTRCAPRCAPSPGGDLLLVGTDISQGRRFAEKFRFATLWGIGLSTLAAALAGFWFSYRLARRVGEVASTCQRIMAGEPGRRLPVAGAHDEFDSLAISVNRVLDRLEEQAGTLRATFDSAAHDLRAPLHRLRTRMDALLLRSPPLEPAVHESVESALREVDHLQRTLATLLQIALGRVGCAAGVAGRGGRRRARGRAGGAVRAGGARPGTDARRAMQEAAPSCRATASCWRS